MEQKSILARLFQIAHKYQVRLYLVGGFVRDMIQGIESEDIDFVGTGDIIRFAEKAASELGGSLIHLGEAYGTLRLALGDRPVIIDLAQMRGRNITADLAERDITINAMALLLEDFLTGQMQKIIDPYGGLQDLKNKRIRAISADVLAKDPVRILRVFRFAAQRGFTITRETLSWCQELAEMLSETAGERVVEEFSKILSYNGSYKYVIDLVRVGLFAVLFPELEQAASLKGRVEEQDFPLAGYWFIEQLPDILPLLDDDKRLVKAYLGEELSGKRTRKSLLKTTFLLQELAQKNWVECLGSNWMLQKLSRKELAIISLWLTNFKQPYRFYREDQSVGKAKLFLFFKSTHQESPGALLLALAHAFASQDEIGKKYPGYLNLLLRMLKDFFANEVYVSPPKLVDGTDLMRELSIGESPVLGKLLDEIALAQVEERVKTKEEALAFARAQLGNMN